MNQELAEFAVKAKNGDWTAPFSDSHSVWSRFEDWKASMAKEAKQKGPNFERVWELAKGFESCFTWWEDRSREGWEERTAERFESGWRWAGAYLWAHGVVVGHEEAKALVGAPSSRDPKYDHIHTTGYPNWEAINEIINNKGE